MFRTQVVVFLFTVCAYVSGDIDTYSALVDLINEERTTWTAQRNFPDFNKTEDFRKLLGVLEDCGPSALPEKKHNLTLTIVPEAFDSREAWPYCKSMNEIRDQGSCMNDFAVAAASTMADRICIYSKGAKNFRISAQDITSCCMIPCFNARGCLGGCAGEPWRYWTAIGIVSGGAYNSSEGCRPYEIEPCEHGTKGPRISCYDPEPTQPCFHSCSNSDMDYKKDKHFAESAYYLHPDEAHIKVDIYHNGPVVAVFNVYEDFVHYRSGIYEHKHGQFVGRHAVKILGWGVEDGVKYWLLANSWNTDWGEGGFFRVVRGVDMCDIETEIYAGEPHL